MGVISAPVLYSASASFLPQGFDAARVGFSGLAGQLGLAMPSSGNQSLSPEFYSRLVQSRVLLGPIVRDTFVVEEMGGKRIAFMDLFQVAPGPQAAREEAALSVLQGIVTPSVVAQTGAVHLAATTPWRSVSLAIVTEVMEGINDYNQRMRQSQAAAERRFVEGQLEEASSNLRNAENNMERFLRANRGDLGGSPELALQRDRLQREVVARQEMFTSLRKAYDDVRAREVRDTPVITVFEPPWASTQPLGRGRLRRVKLGALLGMLVGALLVFITAAISHRRNQGDPQAEELFRRWEAFKQTIRRRLPWRRRE